MSSQELAPGRFLGPLGLTIVGTGINANGDTEAFIATIPEAATLTLFALGSLTLLRRRRGA